MAQGPCQALCPCIDTSPQAGMYILIHSLSLYKAHTYKKRNITSPVPVDWLDHDVMQERATFSLVYLRSPLPLVRLFFFLWKLHYWLDFQNLRKRKICRSNVKLIHQIDMSLSLSIPADESLAIFVCLWEFYKKVYQIITRSLTVSCDPI